MKLLLIATLFSLCGSLCASTQLIVNGSLNSTVVGLNVNSFNGVVADSWNIVPFNEFLPTTPDTFSPATNFYDFTYPTNSPSGHYAHLSVIGGYQGEGLWQTVTGAVVGATYILEFDQSIDRCTSGLDGTGFLANFEVNVNGNTYFSTPMEAPETFSGTSVWLHQSFSFVATANTFVVQLAASTDPNNYRMDMALDNISLTAVPEPTSGVLAAATLMLGLLRRGRQR